MKCLLWKFRRLKFSSIAAARVNNVIKYFNFLLSIYDVAKLLVRFGLTRKARKGRDVSFLNYEWIISYRPNCVIIHKSFHGLLWGLAIPLATENKKITFTRCTHNKFSPTLLSNLKLSIAVSYLYCFAVCAVQCKTYYDSVIMICRTICNWISRHLGGIQSWRRCSLGHIIDLPN